MQATSEAKQTVEHEAAPWTRDVSNENLDAQPIVNRYSKMVAAVVQQSEKAQDQSARKLADRRAARRDPYGFD